MIEQSEQVTKIRADEIYTSKETHSKLSYFYNSNKIISAPHHIRLFFKHFNHYTLEDQEKILTELLNAIKMVTTNSYVINQFSDQPATNKKYCSQVSQKQIAYYDKHLEGKSTILQYLLDLMLSNVKNYLIFNLLHQILDQVFIYSNLSDDLIKIVTQKLIINYYDGKVYATDLFAATNILKSYFHAKLVADKDPKKLMVFHGGNGIEISPIGKQNLSWIIGGGYSLLFWINLQNIKFGNQVSLPKLFTFYSPDNGGVESYLIDNKIYYRILGGKYTDPQIGSNGILLGQLETKKWNFVCFEHEGYRTFYKSKLNFYLNRNKPASYSLDPPKTSSNAQTKYIFFDKIYGKTSSICLFSSPIGLEVIDQYNKNMSSLENVKSSKALVFEIHQGKVYQRSGFGMCHNFIFERNSEMNFQLVLPLFYFLKYQQVDQKYPTFNQLLGILILFLRKSAQNQNQACRKGFFQTISQLICQVPRNIFDENTIKSILHIKHTITDANLLNQYFSDFLWPLLNANTKLVRKQQILEIIKTAFTQNIAHYAPQIGIDQMINLLQQIEGNSMMCCQKHFKIASKKFDRSIEGNFVFGEEKNAQTYILHLIQLSFQNQKLNYAHEIYKLCGMLCLKFSPCLMLELMQLIKKLLTQKFNQKLSENQTKQIIKYFQQKQIHLIFLHVIENNFFAEIKSESVKLIYNIFMKKSTAVEENYISELISKSIWKINQFDQKQTYLTSEKKQQQPEIKKGNEIQIQPPKIQDQNDEFIAVGPQAPAISNRLKGKKTFDFNFISNENSHPPRHQQIMQEEKTNETALENNSQIILPKKKEKKKMGFSLSINTEAINEMYTFGGEKGQQIIITEDQQNSQLQKIIKLAKKCVSAMKGQISEVGVQQNKRSSYIPPPMTTKNKNVIKKKALNLNFIAEQEEETPVIKIPTPLATKKSNKSPTSIKSSNEENLLILYNSLLECCLGVKFQTSLISNSKIQVPSILSIFFKWIPQTQLETKFLNDLEIILEFSENMTLTTQIPELYDFLFQLSYKCLLFQEMGEKRIYTQKLQNMIKNIFCYIFREDLYGYSKFSFILDWSELKKEDYHPKCLFLTTRYIILLILECIEQHLIMNMSNDKIMQRNFQSIAIILESLKKITNIEVNDIKFDKYQRVIFDEDFSLPQSLIPYFKSTWADYILYQKYLFLFKRFYSTQWYLKGLKKFNLNNEDFIDYLMQSNIMQLSKESSYYLQGNFLISLVDIQRSMMIEMKNTEAKQSIQYENECVWQTIVLIIMTQINKQKNIKNQRSEVIRSFLKSCKILAENGVQRIVEIVPMLSTLKHYLSIANSNNKVEKHYNNSTQILDDIINNYIPQYLLNMQVNDLQSFILNFSQVWIPDQSHSIKNHSQLFGIFKQKLKVNSDETNFIEFISNVIEEENQRKQYTNLILQANRRVIRNNFRKLWNHQRIFNTVWTHPQFKWQQNTMYNKSLYSFQKYQPSSFYKYKVSKHISKSKVRNLLKVRLNSPQFEIQQSENQIIDNEYNLQKAILSLKNRLDIGISKRSWINLKGDDTINFIMPFKKIKIINTLTVRSGSLAIINDYLFFVSVFQIQKQTHLAIDQYKILPDKTLHKSWPLEFIRQIYKRRYVNRKKSVQINFINAKSVLFDFESEEQCDDFIKRLMKLKNKCINFLFSGKSLDPKKLFESQDYFKKWNNYQISTFEYLMELNQLSGRSFSDVTQYPVFPWILINFQHQKCNLGEATSYRNLVYPMGLNGTQARSHNFQERYEMIQMEDENASKFHYGTHYSSPGIVYHFLIRLSPFTEGSILLQSGKFDFADRLFFSMEDSYKNAIAEYSDVRQLIPDLYAIPQMYLNINGLNLGVMQNKKRVHNVQLPQWAKQNPFYYVSILRKSLEESIANNSIHAWIDLIFGYKQRGEEAIKAINCFYYLTYEDSVHWQKIKNSKDIQSIESQIVNFGQTPSQILTKPHQQRQSLQNFKSYKLIADNNSELKVYRPSRNRQLLGEQLQLNPLKQVDESIIHMKWINDVKLVFIRRSGDIVFYKWHVNSGPNTKIPFQCTIEKEKRVDRIKKQFFDPNEYFDPSLSILSFPIQFLGLGHTLCLGGLADGKLALIDTETNSLINIYQAHSSTISCVKADSKSNFLFTGDIKGNIVMWQIKTTNNISKLVQKKHIKDQYAQISSIFFSSELQCVAVASLDGSVFLYSMITGKRLRVYYHPHRSQINQVVISSSPLAAIYLFSNSESTIYGYSINGQLISRVLEKGINCFLSPIIMKDSINLEHIAYGNQKSEVQIRSLPLLDNPRTMKVARDACVNKVCVSKYGRFLVTGCSDGELTVVCDPN